MKLVLIKKVKEARNTHSFVFEKPDNFKYLAGQHVYLTIPQLKSIDSTGPSRIFSLSSSPTEKFIQITTTTRERSGFKADLKSFKAGMYVEIEGPSGTFIMDEHEKGDHVFIAGGIGITPFRSMLKYSLDTNIRNKISLIYSNKIPEEITFGEDLNQWGGSESVNVFITITRPRESKVKWSGIKGRIDRNLIKKASRDMDSPTYWLAGPPTMVEGISSILDNMGAKKLRTEKFTGY